MTQADTQAPGGTRPGAVRRVRWGRAFEVSGVLAIAVLVLDGVIVREWGRGVFSNFLAGVGLGFGLFALVSAVTTVASAVLAARWELGSGKRTVPLHVQARDFPVSLPIPITVRTIT